jgi:hypothetical protein
MDEKYLVVIYVLVMIQLLDLITTWVGISSGRAKESNPRLKWLMDKFGWKIILVVVKLTLAGISVGMLWMSAGAALWLQWSIWVVLGLLATYYVLVIVNNINVLDKDV